MTRLKKAAAIGAAGVLIGWMILPGGTSAATVKVHLTAEEKTLPISAEETYEAWTYNGKVPGPVVRVKQGTRSSLRWRTKGPGPIRSTSTRPGSIPASPTGASGSERRIRLPGRPNIPVSSPTTAGPRR